MARTWSLEALGLAGDPAAEPLSYPGVLPQAHGLLVDGCYLRLIPSGRREVGGWLVEAEEGRVELDVLLGEHGRPGTGERYPVLSVGSNAAPAQLRRKFEGQGVEALVPMVKSRVAGIVPGMSAHVSRYGYVPATCVRAPGQQVELFVAWLDEDELRAVDATEPNYDRVLLAGDHFPVLLPSGERLQACSAYISKWGCLARPDGELWPLVSQRDLLGTLLAGSVPLRELFGDTPESFTERAADDVKRKHAQRIFHDEGWVRPQPELEQLRDGPARELAYAWGGAHGR
jgi:hypothetical protein